jgi:hypothetical protein
MRGESGANKLLSVCSKATMALTTLKSQRPRRRDATRRSSVTASAWGDEND